MYSTTWCGFCARLRSQLDRAGVGYREIDVDTDENAAQVVMAVNGGNRTVPTLIFDDGSTLTNPSLDQVKDRLDVGRAG